MRPTGFWRPCTRTTLADDGRRRSQVEADQEVLELAVKNTGAMTALFCEPHPLLEYRTDLFIDNNHCFIPHRREPHRSRSGRQESTKKKKKKKKKKSPAACRSVRPAGGSPWWNADDVVIEPSDDVLLAVGRRDQMCREFLGYFDTGKCKAQGGAILLERAVGLSLAELPYLLSSGNLAFRVPSEQRAGETAGSAADSHGRPIERRPSGS